MNIQLKDVDNVVFNGIDVSAVKFNDVLVWRKWETIEYTGAVPVTITAAGEPLIDLIISGNMSQSGVPSPTTPIQPQETGERTGNLWDKGVPIYAYATDYKKYNSNNAIALKAGTYTISSDGILPQIQAFHADLSPYADIQDVIQKDANMCAGWDNRALLPTANTIRRTTVAIAEDCIITFSCIGTYAGTYIMLNTGSTALPYSPYGYKISFLSANTTTPVYLGEVESTRRIKKLVLTGNEDITATTGNAPFVLPLLDIIQVNNRQIILFACSHYEAVSNSASWSQYNSCVSWSFSGGINVKSLVFRDTSCADVDAFKTYLAQQYANGTPVTIWYVLATPTTGIVNEPLRKIGNYADSLSVSQTIPTVEGENVVDVETTLKPSEVYIKYKGKSS